MCGHQLKAWENIPVISWVVLRAKCHSCNCPIPARYPAVEALCGLALLAVGLRYGMSLVAVGVAIGLCGALVVAAIGLDGDHVPASVLWWAVGSEAVVLLGASAFDRHLERILGLVVGGVILVTVEVTAERLLSAFQRHSSAAGALGNLSGARVPGGSGLGNDLVAQSQGSAVAAGLVAGPVLGWLGLAPLGAAGAVMVVGLFFLSYRRLRPCLQGVVVGVALGAAALWAGAGLPWTGWWLRL